MNLFRTILILAAAFLAVFGEATLPVLHHWLGAQVDLLPVLMVYAALNTDIVTVSTLAVLGGLTVLYAGALLAIVIAFRRYLARQPRPFAATLQEALGMPVVLENDGNAAVLGEALAGAAAGAAASSQ